MKDTFWLYFLFLPNRTRVKFPRLITFAILYIN
nr:MAG TPA: hypothetical protein [Caudoviricetes sp.]